MLNKSTKVLKLDICNRTLVHFLVLAYTYCFLTKACVCMYINQHLCLNPMHEMILYLLYSDNMNNDQRGSKVNHNQPEQNMLIHVYEILYFLYLNEKWCILYLLH